MVSIRLVGWAAAGAVLSTSAVVFATLGQLESPATVAVAAERGTAFDVNPAPPTPTARYRVTFVVEWDSSTHPSTLPGNAHVSPAVVAVHSEAGAMFSPGTIASTGIERMAEVGATSTLIGELAANASVATTDTGRRIDLRGTDTFEFDVSQTNRYLSLVSMLAPSPDWFVGADSVDLFDDGDWVHRFDMALDSYDAGTDNGANFTSPNSDTSPAEAIAGPRDAAFQAAAAEGAFGRLVIERIG